MVRFFIFICIIVVSSCGKQEFPDYSDEENLPQFEEADGTFTSTLIPMNTRLVKTFKSRSLMWFRGDQFYIRIVGENGESQTRYHQYIHAGSRCPDGNDDMNQDGMIDFSEVIAVSGPILVPLDRNLENQEEGEEWFPTSNRKGFYYYSRSASVMDFLADLYSEDIFPTDNLAKLKAGEKFDPEKRVIILYGSKSDPFLPVACGIWTPTSRESYSYSSAGRSSPPRLQSFSSPSG